MVEKIKGSSKTANFTEREHMIIRTAEGTRESGLVGSHIVLEFSSIPQVIRCIGITMRGSSAVDVSYPVALTFVEKYFYAKTGVWEILYMD